MRRMEIAPAEGFRVLAATSSSQAAIMVLAAGSSVGGADNVHAASDQWLYVLEGEGEAVVGNERVALTASTLLLIESGEPHEIRASDAGPLRTLNFYAPPEY